ncbi:MAG: hypothetical protein IPO78_02805 [Saprospiraceae bacterium]|nr:hypothetical protein [Saprospiraceae bacterium]
MHLIFNEQEKIETIDFFTKPKGTMMPLQDGKKKFLEGYLPRDPEKPFSLEDIITRHSK